MSINKSNVVFSNESIEEGIIGTAQEGTTDEYAAGRKRNLKISVFVAVMVVSIGAIVGITLSTGKRHHAVKVATTANEVTTSLSLARTGNLVSANIPTNAPTTYAPTHGGTPTVGKIIRACKSQKECSANAIYFDNYYIGEFPEVGCFSKGGNLFWSEGGTLHEKLNLELSGGKERLMCNCYEDWC